MIKQFFESHPELGYRNPSEFIMETISQKFEEFKKKFAV
jgi:hypothetical protein